MRQLSFIFLMAVAFVGLTSTTCKDRIANPGRPFPIDTTPTGPPPGNEGNCRIVVRSYTPSGNYCSNAEVFMHATLSDARAGTPYLIKQNTSSDGQGATTITWEPGEYYIVAKWNDGSNVPHISDTAKVKGFICCPTPNSQATGPQKILINKDQTTSANVVVDYRE